MGDCFFGSMLFLVLNWALGNFSALDLHAEVSLGGSLRRLKRVGHEGYKDAPRNTWAKSAVVIVILHHLFAPSRPKPPIDV